MLVNIAIGVAVVIVLLAIYIATRPPTFRIVRSVTIAAPANVPFALINDFHGWSQWSPFDKLDPNLQRTYPGSASGVGSGYTWTGNSRAGAGTMTITESVPDDHINIDLQFEKPFKARNLTEFTFKPMGNSVNVSWAMSGKNTTMGKVMGLVMNMDISLGAMFEEGLANLKKASDANANKS